ncbi:MAG TPA: tyrosine-type recombinase/integrase [Aggregatilinea sp.]|uniref:tyrosine-type recombinase/integrase n=1 Tax=Aggregatilinea sp. TaxID=2806333 RepID=UPI002C91A88D|nr:tyrosine-type recombinase/integrase [Aggregatilinea sp.]HML23378.1 tyrosine-type recombinase/integrase [Aggregatilinea sp.]
MHTLRTAAESFLLEDRSPATRRTYRQVLDRALSALGPARDVTSVTRDDILRYIQSLREQSERYADHPRRPAERGSLSPRTVQKHSQTLGTFFAWLQENGYREDNPASKLRLRKWKRPPGESKAATPEELRAILHVAEAKAALGKPLHLAIFLFLCDTGCRAGEAANLVVGNLQLSNHCAWTVGKGDKVRPLFFGVRTAEALQAWLDVHPHPTTEALLFGMEADSISQVVARMAQVAGCTRAIGAHAIRHRVGQVWQSAKMSEQATQLKLGHDNPLITIEMYYNTSWEHIRFASERLALAAIDGVPDEPPRLAPPKVVPIARATTRAEGLR